MNRSRLTVKSLKNAGIAFAIGASLVGTPSFGQKEGLARETLEQLITVPPSELSDADLALRIQLNRRLLNDNVAEIGGVKLRALLKADRQELRRRGKAEDGEQNDNAQAPAAEPKAAEDNAGANDQAEDRRQQRREERREAQDQAAQEQAAKDQAAQEQAARDQAAKDQAARDQAAQEQAAKDQAAKDQAARDQAAQDKAAQDQDTRAERRRRERDDAAAAAAAAETERQRNAETSNTDNETNANRLARRSLEDDRASGSLTVAQLRERIGETEDILKLDGLRRALENALKDRLAADNTSLESKLATRGERREERREERRDERREQRQEDRQAERDQQQQQDTADRNPQANQAARQLLEDQRPAARLGMPELRERVQRTRDVLREDGLRERLSLQLRERLAEDREELRNRVAEREGRTTDRELRVEILQNRALRDELLADRRPSSTLNDRELDERIEHASSLLEENRMRPAVRAGVQRMLENDRAEKRERLLAAREDRRRKLRREARRPDGFSIELGTSGVQFGLDIIAAEEDHDTIQRQLMAPPRRDIQRRYSLREFQQQPDLRDVMPGIELDTIRFGTNEAFVRAEEISNLDAIGEIIEEVVYNRPEEIFLIEGHTDAVGSDAYNLRLSEQRALAVKEALLDYFNIPPANLITIGYGERYLRIPTPYAEQENRRVSVRRVTPLLSQN
uniref:OmpA family protein n=1 Tax=Pararhizobium sp. IMCC3301 TaxID=3067904 RepID=UPI0027411A0B|nr:OmpA family protein [Pararhizobium sp. IMCC3301]